MLTCICRSNGCHFKHSVDTLIEHQSWFPVLQVIYGSYSTDVNDQQSLGAMIDYWVSPTAVKKDFEVARCT